MNCRQMLAVCKHCVLGGNLQSSGRKMFFLTLLGFLNGSEN